MNSRSRQWFKQIGTGLMILVIGIMLVNKTVYTHVHILPDGSVVTHAHPFSKNAESNNNTSHQHSSFDFFLLDLLEVLILCAIAAFVLRRPALTTHFKEVATDRLLPALVPVSTMK